jgi:hypothetical protein
MTPVEFIAQLDALRRRVRPMLLVGGVLVLLVDAAIVYYVFQLYPPEARSREPLIADSIALLACCPAIGALYLALRRMIRKYAPACRTCGATATWKLRAEILTTGHCPSCHAAFFSVPPPRRVNTSMLEPSSDW